HHRGRLQFERRQNSRLYSTRRSGLAIAGSTRDANLSADLSIVGQFDEGEREPRAEDSEARPLGRQLKIVALADARASDTNTRSNVGCFSFVAHCRRLALHQSHVSVYNCLPLVFPICLDSSWFTRKHRSEK